MNYPQIDPVALELGPLAIHWYGLMYLFGFVAAWMLARSRANDHGWEKSQVEDLLFYGAIGVIIGGRIGYALFYDLPNVINNPLNLFKVWQGGMSFHGGLLGVLLAIWLFGRKTNRSFFEISDFVAPLVPLGLFFGRIGNFINGELWGRVSDVPWAMVFPTGGPLARHPSQLYQAMLEGLLLFIILWWFSAKTRPRAAVSGLFLLGYGGFRFIAEFFRVPDPQYGYLAFDWFTMGQLLCVPMVIAGLIMMIWAYQRKT
ncbi:MAG: prolipoprotein diacylglyceryl transferase [Methylophaga sp.]|uniref:prolipoprotein diacylglyceryl transferase n=1 Tax=Methylophaga sp. TaxID=2024840 RepID=UPI000C0F4F8A|nr:prolipoprotein diacylglyceryl transferase [Methylophaga sp.]MBL1458750.1 prolipoprotein diacylglyceryl transferase [Methylophaga sp.]|tara:strand:+ start:928 stop:1701 length:774 start_codon:yes stop_codon:yes gene_type:complete